MASWSAFAEAESDLAAPVAAIIATRRHKTLATVRPSGAPRVSGIECEIADGEVRLGMMPRSVKLADVRRDPRVAIHALSDDPPPDAPRSWGGDVKLSGRLVEEPGSGGEDDGAGFHLDIEEVAWIRLEGPPDVLVIDSWRAGRGRMRYERD
ncbi:MAG TPA: pyridoxamine 5'-phosphate oxidase family protein [Candidatus Dormibacteraeota bacterium]|nr:pyridoxamine 5'-phosphate oxidase family protein [Candidatus Dormibacteraeota bacterium]